MRQNPFGGGLPRTRWGSLHIALPCVHDDADDDDDDADDD